MTSPSDAVVAAGGGDDDGNPYLAMRAAKIARNERRLRELGLSSSSSSSSSSGPAGGPRRRPSPSSSPPAVARRRRRPDEFGSATTPGAPPPPARRRSDRILSSRREVGEGSSAVAEGPRGVVVVVEEARTRRRPRFPDVAPPGDDVASPSLVPVVPGRSGDDDDDDDWGAPAAPPPAPPANSVRSIDLDVEALVLGGRDDPDDGPGLRDGGGMLGRMAERPGKECVVLASISAAAGGGDRLRFEGGGARVSFNKYSGVQEWKVGGTDRPSVRVVRILPFFHFFRRALVLSLCDPPSSFLFSSRHFLTTPEFRLPVGQPRRARLAERVPRRRQDGDVVRRIAHARRVAGDTRTAATQQKEGGTLRGWGRRRGRGRHLRRRPVVSTIPAGGEGVHALRLLRQDGVSLA